MENNKPKQNGVRFFEVTILNLLITIVELLGGIFSGSLSLLSDAVHNLGDSVSIVIAYAASRISERSCNKSKTYGYRRAEILSSYFNSIFLLVMSAGLIWEAIRRLIHPVPVNGTLMLIVAVVGLIANSISAFMLHQGSHHNLNIKATYLHILSDALASFGVIIGAILIKIFQISWIDPVITILVAIYIAYKTIPIVIESTNILMEAGPKIDYEEVRQAVLEIPGVYDIHHVHAWMIDEKRIMFTAHIDVSDDHLSEIQPIYQEIKELLKQRYHIKHVTLQAEVDAGVVHQILSPESTED